MKLKRSTRAVVFASLAIGAVALLAAFLFPGKRALIFSGLVASPIPPVP